MRRLAPVPGALHRGMRRTLTEYYRKTCSKTRDILNVALRSADLALSLDRGSARFLQFADLGLEIFQFSFQPLNDRGLLLSLS